MMAVLTTLTVAGFIGTVLADAAKGVLGDRADAGVQAAWRAVREHFGEKTRLQNHDLDRAVARSFLMAQFSICQDCLRQPALRRELGPGEVAWLEYRAMRLKAMVKDLKEARPTVPSVDLPSLADMMDLGAVESDRNHVRVHLVQEAIADSVPPDPYALRLKQCLYERMSAYFQVEIKHNDVIRYIFEAQLLSVIWRDIANQRITLGQMEDHLESLADELATVREANETIEVELASFRGDVSAKLDRIFDLLMQLLETRSVVTRPRAEVFELAGHQLTEYFTGRKDALDQLAEGFDNAQGRRQVLVGMGGLGKTQVALRYCHEHRPQYQVVFWIRAEKTQSIERQLARLAVRLGLEQEPVKDQAKAALAAKAWLNTNSDWLLVFDNAESEEVLDTTVSSEARGHVLVTSRIQQWSASVRVVELRVWTEKVATAFLSRRLKREESSAADLANELGCLPLALEQAAAYVLNGSTIPEYLTLLRTHRPKLLSYEGRALKHLEPVSKTWDLSFAAVEQQSPAAASLLKVCAFLEPDEIPLDLFRRGAEVLPEPLKSVAADNFDLLEAVGILNCYSLVVRSGEHLWIHRLVQAVLQDQFSEVDYKMWLGLTAAAVAAALARYLEQVECATDDASYKIWGLAPHAISVGRFAHHTPVASAAFALRNLGLLHCTTEALLEAKKAFEGALEVVEAVYGSNDPHLAVHLNDLGSVLFDLLEVEHAKGYFERSLRICEAYRGPDDPSVAVALKSLGMALYDLDHLDAAKECLERSLDVFTRRLGADSPFSLDVDGVLQSLLSDIKHRQMGWKRLRSDRPNTWG